MRVARIDTQTVFSRWAQRRQLSALSGRVRLLIRPTPIAAPRRAGAAGLRPGAAPLRTAVV